MNRSGDRALPSAARHLPWGLVLALLCGQEAGALAVKSYVADTDGITATCDKGVMKVQICQADIVRVAYSPGATIPVRPIKIVTKAWGAPTFTKTEDGDTITLQTSKLIVKVSKATANVSYSDLSGETILAEYAKTATAATVEGVATNTLRGEFVSPADEVQDWHYWDGAGKQGCYCFNNVYGDVKSTITQLHDENIHTLISIWSQLEDGTANFSTFNTKGWLWPSDGTTHFIDTYNKDAREAFWTNMKNAFFDPTVQGWDGWWFDNDEPFPYPDGVNRRTVNTAMGKGVLFYNSYTFPMTETFYRNWRADIPDKRAVILHRANFPGQQAHSTMQWNNDIAVSFSTLKNSVTSGLNSTMTGIPYWTTDIGGYWGANVDYSTATNQELMVRWLQYGAFLPIFRIHGNMMAGQGKELYSTTFTAATRANLLISDKLRYRLMPYHYSLAWMTTSADYTPMRSLIFDFRADPNVKSVGNQYMYGPAFMVSPVTTEGATSRSVYFPGGQWYDFWTGQLRNGGNTMTVNAPLSQIPLHMRAGSIVPMGPDIQHANERADTIELRIYPGADGSFTMYEDQGDGYDYETGKYATIPITYVDETRNVIIGARKGSFPGMDAKKVFNIVFVGNDHGTGIGITAAPDQQLVYTGEQVSISTVGVRRTASDAPKRATIRSAGNLLRFPDGFQGRNKSLSVYALSGKLVLKTEVRKDEIDLQRDLGLATGDYVVKVETIR